MMRRGRRSGRPSKIKKTVKPVALFASMIVVFYDNAVLAKGYVGAFGPYPSLFGKCFASQVKQIDEHI